MSWIDKILPAGVRSEASRKKSSSVPEGLWKKCVKCDAVLYRPDVERNEDVCPKCDHHMRIGARKRLARFLDTTNNAEILSEIEPVDRLKFKDKKRYRDRLSAAQKSTGEKDALIAMRGTLRGLPIIALAFEFEFHGGSMGYAVGEKFARAAQLALEDNIPLVCFSASGGARMQEALISLMQMAKTSAVIERMKLARVPYISVMTDPIYGGVSASLALLGDINIAEPDARAGFAGPNIIEQTIRQKLPKGFQRSEFLLEHGAIDMIVHRTEMRDTIARLLSKLTAQPLAEPTETIAITYQDDDAPKAIAAGGDESAPLEHWLQRLATIHPREIELGLERVRAVALQLGLLPVPQPVVTVAGTNGKGSTVAVLDALLTEAGYRTGIFTSPHLLHFNERIRIAGVDASDEAIIAAFEAIEAARRDISLTYFEFATLAALLIFKENAPDIIVLEVGLGGRLDAVNIVDAAVSVITSIDLDHQDWLGGSRGEIAREKAGIVRASKPVVIAEPAPPPELLGSIHEVGAGPVLQLGQEFKVTTADGKWRAQLQCADGTPRLLPAIPCGGLLPENICAAIQASLLLDIKFDDELLLRALAKAAPVARRQRLEIAGKDYVLDVAHNPAAVNKLLEYLTVNSSKGKTLCLFSVMADKDVSSMVNAAAGYFDAWFLADQPGNPRAATAQTVAALLAAAGQTMISCSKNLRQALRRAQGIMSAGDRLVVFGSFYTVAGVLPLLDTLPGKDDITHEAL